MRQNIAEPATLQNHQDAWPDYQGRLHRAWYELATLENNATTNLERNRLYAKRRALAVVINRWYQVTPAVTPDTTTDQYRDLWAAFASRTFDDWLTAYQVGEAGNADSAAYATGLGLALDLQRGYAPGIDSPPYIADWHATNTPN